MVMGVFTLPMLMSIATLLLARLSRKLISLVGQLELDQSSLLMESH